MGDSTMNFHWVDNDALTVEKTVTEKAGDITKAGSELLWMTISHRPIT